MWECEGRHERGEAQYEENPLILYPTRKRNENRSESPPRKKIDTEFLLQLKDKTPLEVVEDDVEMEMSIANTTLRRYISSSLLFTVLSLYFFSFVSCLVLIPASHDSVPILSFGAEVHIIFFHWVMDI